MKDIKDILRYTYILSFENFYEEYNNTFEMLKNSNYELKKYMRKKHLK